MGGMQSDAVVVDAAQQVVAAPVGTRVPVRGRQAGGMLFEVIDAEDLASDRFGARIGRRLRRPFPCDQGYGGDLTDSAKSRGADKTINGNGKRKIPRHGSHD